MKKGNHKIFFSKPLLYQMVNLRMNGFAISSLAGLFMCDKSSIRAQIHKYGLPHPETTYTIERIISKLFSQKDISKLIPNYDIVEGIQVNRGRSYRDYLS